MVHIIFDGSEVKLENFHRGGGQVGSGGGGDNLSFFEGLPPRYQRGYGYFAGHLRQRGQGLGDIFKSLWRVLRPVAANIGSALGPVAKEAGKAIGQEGIATGARVLNEIVQGKNAKAALENEGREGVKRLLDRASTRVRQQGSGGRRRRKLPGTNVILKPGDLVSARSIIAAGAATRKRRGGGRGGGGRQKKRSRVDNLGIY
jgi:hypothetical protein